MKTSRYFSDKIILICAACVILSFTGQIFQLTPVVNSIYAFSLLLVFFCYFVSGYVSQIMLILIGLIAVASVAHGFVANDMDYFSHILIVLCSFMCIEVGADAKIGIDTYKKVSYMFLLTGLVLEVAYYLGPLKTSYFKWTDAICLNFPNPNAAGLWVCCIFILLIYAFFLFRGFAKIMFLGVAIGLLPIILATQSRNSYLACLVLIFGALVAKIFRIKKVPNWVLGVIACLPLIVFVFYMFVIVKNMDFWQELFAIDSIDKGLGTRENMWQKVLNNFWHCFLFGDYRYYYNAQMHNSLLTIFCRFGAPATVVVCVLLYKALKKIQDNATFYAVLSLAAVLFTGCFEASVFIGIAGLYLMLLIIPAGASAEYNYSSKIELMHLDSKLFEATFNTGDEV